MTWMSSTVTSFITIWYAAVWIVSFALQRKWLVAIYHHSRTFSPQWSWGSMKLLKPPLWQEHAVHQDQNLTPQESFFPSAADLINKAWVPHWHGSLSPPHIDTTHNINVKSPHVSQCVTLKFFVWNFLGNKPESNSDCVATQLQHYHYICWQSSMINNETAYREEVRALRFWCHDNNLHLHL